jgi:hypothetical protein
MRSDQSSDRPQNRHVDCESDDRAAEQNENFHLSLRDERLKRTRRSENSRKKILCATKRASLRACAAIHAASYNADDSSSTAAARLAQVVPISSSRFARVSCCPTGVASLSRATLRCAFASLRSNCCRYVRPTDCFSQSRARQCRKLSRVPSLVCSSIDARLERVSLGAAIAQHILCFPGCVALLVSFAIRSPLSTGTIICPLDTEANGYYP